MPVFIRAEQTLMCEKFSGNLRLLLMMFASVLPAFNRSLTVEKSSVLCVYRADVTESQ